MEGFVTAKEAAELWKVSPTWITMLCKQGRINGAIKNGKKWMIPTYAKKPNDQRKKNDNPIKKSGFTFVDLFAGIGGFHQAMRSLGGRCIMASEINQACVETYKMNFATQEGDVRGDLTKVDPSSIAPFDVLCAGFPCQSFSKAGNQLGFQDPKRGNLFYTIMTILDKHPEVQYIVLENVRNLADKTENWNVVQAELRKRDFIITKEPLILSPSDFGLPQIRERVYILGIKRERCTIALLKQGYIDHDDLHINEHRKKCKIGDALSILEDNVSPQYHISEEQAQMIQAWDELRIATGIKTIGYPIWISCFGYGIDDDNELRRQVCYEQMPDWKKAFVDKNRAFYVRNRQFIDKWIVKYDMLNRIKLYQKFEWNCGEDVTDMHDAIIQIRQSGIRAKRTTFFPSLVAIVNTPIVWDKGARAYRHITPREAANLQDFDKDYIFVGTDKQIYSQLGNSVNVKVLQILCKNLFELQMKGGEKQWVEK